MEGQESNEDEEAVLDYKTPKGQLIQFVEQKLKKPEIDDDLGKVLDKFQELTKEQTTYLDIGIFHMNFTEDALLIQCCGQLYGKRVDKLWEELLQFHTRMVKYDEKNVKSSGDVEKIKTTKQEIAKLEERLNRGKRKKIVLAEPESENRIDPVLSDDRSYLINLEQSEYQLFGPDNRKFPLAKDDVEVGQLSFEDDEYEDWDLFNSEHEMELVQNFNSQLVMEYNKVACRFKSYQSPFSDEMIYDLTEPEVYNTKEGKLISCQLIRQMFEDNDNCLIPDENFVIARLRIAYSVKKKWLLRNKIDPTDYKSYKEAWQKYKSEFYTEERRKIQNMPQKSKEDVIKFFEALRKKEDIAKEKVQELEKMGVKNLPAISFHTVIVEPLREDYDGIFDPYIPEGFEVPSVPAVNFEENSALEDGLDDCPQTAIVSDHFNQTADSGYIGDPDEIDHEELDKSAVGGAETPFEEHDETSCQRSEGATSPSLGRVTPLSENENDITDPNESGANLDPSDSFDDIKLFMNSQDSMEDNVKIMSDAQREEMNSALKEFVQHDESLYKTLENCHFEETDGIIAIFYNKPSSIQTDKLQKLSKKKDHDNAQQKNPLKRKLDNPSIEDKSVPKRRKLSKKQVEKLKKSLIIPVNELKWDSFYSHNYQPGVEEGVIARVDYQSDTEDEDMFDNINEENINDLSSRIEPENNEEQSDLLECSQFTQDSGIGTSMNLTQEESQVEEPAIQNDTAEISEVPQNDDTSAPAETSNIITDINKNINVLDDKAKYPLAQFGDKERERHEMRIRVEEWRKYITPKLKTLEEQEFDIHKYSANIINSVEVNETKPFAEIISGKCSTEVVRYFISSLQLANTLNVEICGVTQGQLSNDTFQLKLLNKEQYHEHLEEYQAPSEENFRENLKKMKEIRKQNEVLTRKKQHPKRKMQNEDQEFLPQGNFMPRSQKLTVKTKLSQVNPKKWCRILNQDSSLNNSPASILKSTRSQGSNLQQQSTSPQADLADQTQKNQQLKRKVQTKDQEYQPEEDHIGQREKLTIKTKSLRVNLNKNIHILNYGIRSPPREEDSLLCIDDHSQATKSSSSLCRNQELDFEQLSTSWQANSADEQVLTQKKQHPNRKVQKEDQEFLPHGLFTPRSQKLTIKTKLAQVNPKKWCRILNQENVEYSLSNSQAAILKSSQNQGSSLQQQTTSPQANLADQTQKNRQLKRKVQTKVQEYQPEADCIGQRKKLTIKTKSLRVNLNKNIHILNYDIRSPTSQEDNLLCIDDYFQTTKSSSSLCQNQELDFEQLSTSSWQANSDDQQVQIHQDQPQENFLQSQKLTIKSKSPAVSSKEKLKRLSYEMRSPSTSGRFGCFSDTSTTKSGSSQKLHFQQQSTPWQEDLADQQIEIMVDSAISDMDQLPPRSSVDSGIFTSCDEDFLEQFDQLQQISDAPITSTPYPCKILKIKLARHNYGLKRKVLRVNLDRLEYSSN